MKDINTLIDFISKSSKKKDILVILTLGNILQGDDGAGPILFKRYLHKYQYVFPNIFLINAETMVENFIKPIIELKPNKIIIIDAIEAQSDPGTIMFLDIDNIDHFETFSTHNLPLTYFVDQIHLLNSEILFIGIQIKYSEFQIESLSREVNNAIDILGYKLENLLKEYLI